MLQHVFLPQASSLWHSSARLLSRHVNPPFPAATPTPPSTQAEQRRIVSVSSFDDRLQLDSVLSFTHKANYKTYTNEDLELEARAEIMLVDSNVMIASADAASQNALGGEKFGAYVRVTGERALRPGNIWCHAHAWQVHIPSASGCLVICCVRPCICRHLSAAAVERGGAVLRSGGPGPRLHHL